MAKMKTHFFSANFLGIKPFNRKQLRNYAKEHGLTFPWYARTKRMREEISAHILDSISKPKVSAKTIVDLILKQIGSRVKAVEVFDPSGVILVQIICKWWRRIPLSLQREVERSVKRHVKQYVILPDVPVQFEWLSNK